jgi:hypothetical protein
MLNFPSPTARSSWTKNNAAGSFPLVDVAAQFAGDQNPERNPLRVLRPTTVERRVKTFLAQRIAALPFIPRQLPVVRIPAENDAT